MADEGNDFLNPDEIDALLNAARDEATNEDVPAEGADEQGDEPNEAGGGSDLLDPSEIDALLQQRDEQAGGEESSSDEAAPQKSASPPEQEPSTESNPAETVEKAQAHLDEALADGVRMPDPVAKYGTPGEFALESFSTPQQAIRDRQPLEILQDVELDLRIELGRTEMLIEEVVELKEGSVVTLDKLAGDPVDILVNGRLIARGEVLVLNDNFCVRVGEILTPEV